MNGNRLVTWAVLAAFAGILPAVGVSAQDMEFSVEETGQPPAPPAEGPPSEALANALRLYQQERYQEASVQFQRVVEGETQDAPANVQKAQFFLGKSLYHLRFYQSALAIFDEIGQAGAGPQLLRPDAAVARPARHPAPRAGGHHREGRSLRRGSARAVQHRGERRSLQPPLYLMGRYKYGQGEFDEAIQLFQPRDRQSRPLRQAKFFEGIAHVRMRRAQPAIRSLPRIIEAIEEARHAASRTSSACATSRGSRSRASTTRPPTAPIPDSGERIVDGRLLGNAVETWNRIDQGSEYWLDALFEERWAFFLADEYSRALGNIHTLYSPYFDRRLLPGGAGAQGGDVLRELPGGQRRRDGLPVPRALRSRPAGAQLVPAADPGQHAVLRVPPAGPDGRGEPQPADPRHRLHRALDRTLLRHLEYVRVLEGEEARLEQAPPEFKNSSLGARILQDVAVAKSFAVDQTGDLARARYSRLIEDLQDLMNQIDTVDLEIATYERGQPSRESRSR